MGIGLGLKIISDGRAKDMRRFCFSGVLIVLLSTCPLLAAQSPVGKWKTVDENSGKVFCLVEAPDAEAAHAVHREAHGLVADSITEVREGK